MIHIQDIKKDSSPPLFLPPRVHRKEYLQNLIFWKTFFILPIVKRLGQEKILFIKNLTFFPLEYDGQAC